MNSFIISMGMDMRGLIFTANYGQIVIILNKKKPTLTLVLIIILFLLLFRFFPDNRFIGQNSFLSICNFPGGVKNQTCSIF